MPGSGKGKGEGVTPELHHRHVETAIGPPPPPPSPSPRILSVGPVHDPPLGHAARKAHLPSERQQERGWKRFEAPPLVFLGGKMPFTQAAGDVRRETWDLFGRSGSGRPLSFFFLNLNQLPALLNVLYVGRKWWTRAVYAAGFHFEHRLWFLLCAQPFIHSFDHKLLGFRLLLSRRRAWEKGRDRSSRRRMCEWCYAIQLVRGCFGQGIVAWQWRWSGWPENSIASH